VIRVAYIAGEPTPYRVAHLRALDDVGDIELTPIYAARTVQRRTWSVDPGPSARFLRGPTLPLARLLHHDYPLTPQIWSVLERERFDCVVIGGWSLMATQVAILWCRLRGVPYFLVSENTLREPRPRWVRAVKRLVLPRIVPQAAGSLVAGTLAREHQLAYGARPDGVVVFPNTVDVGALAAKVDDARSCRVDIRARLGVPDGAVVALRVGRLVPMKAPELTVDAVARANETTTEKIHLLLVGDGPLEDEVRDLARRRGVGVTLTGLLEGRALVEAYAAADLFVLLSRRETWGIVVNEAMAASLPLVLTDRVGAAADLLVPGENGELVRVDDAGAAGEAIARLADDPELRERYGRRSRELIEPWGYDASVAAFATLVRQVVTDARSRRRTSRGGGR
jgi:glycosyltransferase involved in cell wall biosynthesis